MSELRYQRAMLSRTDLARACVLLMDNVESNPDVINVGTGEDITIRELAVLIQEIVGFKGDLKFDVSRPDGTMRKLLDVSKIKNLGFKAEVNLSLGLKKSYQDYLAKYSAPVEKLKRSENRL